MIVSGTQIPLHDVEDHVVGIALFSWVVVNRPFFTPGLRDGISLGTLELIGLVPKLFEDLIEFEAVTEGHRFQHIADDAVIEFDLSGYLLISSDPGRIVAQVFQESVIARRGHLRAIVGKKFHYFFDTQTMVLHQFTKRSLLKVGQ